MPVPALSTADGIAQVGAFSVIVHVAYVLLLKLNAVLPVLIKLPPANPYILFIDPPEVHALDAAWVLFCGLLFLSLVALVVGYLAGKLLMRRRDKSLFYGPLSDVIQSAMGDDKFITAYVVTKISEGTRLLGYEGTVASLHRDPDRYPVRVVLKDVVPFYFELKGTSPERVETDQLIDWLVLAASDWHNIAFRIFQLVDEDPPTAAQ